MSGEGKRSALLFFMIIAFTFLSYVTSYADTTTYGYDDMNRKVTIQRGTPDSGNILVVVNEGWGSGTVTSAPAGINCGATCAAPYVNNTAVVLTASASAGSSFAGWNGEGCTGTGTCTVVMSQARNVTATFNLLRNILVVVREGFGTGSVTSEPPGIDCGDTCTALYAYNASVTLTASASAGSSFAGWSGEGCTGTGTCTVAMSQARNVTAAFSLCDPVRIGESPFESIQSAYNAAANGAVIKAQATRFTENLTVNRNISVTLEGGYDCNYTNNAAGETLIKGQIRTTTGGGTLSIENAVIEQ